MTKIRNEEYLKAFGEHVRQLRESKSWSQYRMADECNVSRSQIIGIEKGDINTTLSTILVLAKAFEATPSELLDF